MAKLRRTRNYPHIRRLAAERLMRMGNTEVELVSAGEQVDWQAMWREAVAERDAARAEVVRLRAAIEKAQEVLDENTLIELDWREAEQVMNQLRAALAAPGQGE